METAALFIEWFRALAYLGGAFALFSIGFAALTVALKE